LKSVHFSQVKDKSSSGDEIPERDVTYHLICLLSLFTIELRHTCSSRIFF